MLLLNINNNKNIKLTDNTLFINKSIKDVIIYNNVKYLIKGGITCDGKPMVKNVKFKGYKKVWFRKKKGYRFKKKIHGSIISEKIKTINLKIIL